MGNRMGTVAEDYKEEYPGLPSYLKCQSSAFVAGTFALLMGGFGTFFTQGARCVVTRGLSYSGVRVQKPPYIVNWRMLFKYLNFIGQT